MSAERVERSLLTTPIAIGVVGEEEIQRRGVQRLWELNGSIAGIYFNSQPSNMQSVSIRGIGSFDSGSFSGVGLYLDDVYLGRQFGRGPLDFPDIERVEVLRGPQGTLYGQNTTGGAIRVLSRDPSLQQQKNWVSAALGNYGASEARAYLSSPLIEDKLGVSLAYSHRQNNGWTWNDYRKVSVDRLQVDQYRAKVRWSPAEKWDVVLAIDGTNDATDGNTPNSLIGPQPHRPYLIFSNTNTQQSRRDRGQMLKVAFDISDRLTFKSITANRHDTTNPHPWDMDGLSEDYWGWTQNFVEKIRSQEFQLTGDYSRLQFTLGATYYESSFDFGRLQWSNGTYTDLATFADYESRGVYGQGTFNLTERLGVIFGARYGEQDHDFAAASYRSNVNRERLAENYNVTGLHSTETSFTPKLGLKYEWSPTTFTYISATTGEKTGGFNRSAGTLAVASTPVDPEQVTSYELGLKAYAWNRRLFTNLTVFYNDYEDFHATVTNPTINGQLVVGGVAVNAGRAHTQGAELELTLSPLNSLQWQFTLSYLESRYDDFLNPTGAANSDFTGNDIPGSPPWLGATSFNYRLPFSRLPGELRLNGTVNYIAKNFSNDANTLGPPNQTYVNGGLSYASQDGRWNLSLNVKNALDEHYQIRQDINAATRRNTVTYNPPRTVLATLRYDFN